MKKTGLTLFFALTFVLQIIGQDYLKKLYSESDGLPSNNIYSICQDSTGYIWIGTDQGLCRFDGYKFKNYTKPSAILNNPIVDIVKANNQSLLFVTDNGSLWRIEKEEITPYSTNKDFIKTGFSQIENVQGNLLVSLKQKKGLFILKNEDLFPVAKELSEHTIQKLKKDRNNKIFITTDHGIYQYKSDSVITILQNDTMVYKDYLLQEKDTNWFNPRYENEIRWFTTKEHGIFVQYDDTCEYFSGGKNSWFTDLNENSYGEVWASTYIGMFRLIFSNPDYGYLMTELNQRKITATFIDKDDNVWIAAFGQGLYQFTRTFFTTHLFPYGFPGTSAKVLFKDGYDDIWFAAENYGLVLLEPFINKNYDLRNKYPSSDILCGLKKDSALIFAGNNILITKRNEQFIEYYSTNLPKNFIISDMELNDSESIIAVVNQNQLWELKNNTWENIFSDFNSSINELYKDNDNQLWICFNDSICLIQDDLNTIEKKFDIPEVTSICQIQDNEYWIGTKKGIYKTAGDTINQIITIEYGLISNSVTAVSKIGDKIFIGSEHGLTVYYNDMFYQFGTNLGLKNNNINKGNIEFIENRLAFFGTNNGFTIFELRYFDDLKLVNCSLNKVVCNTDTITDFEENEFLKFNKHSKGIEFYFDVIDYRQASKKIKFRVYRNQKLLETIETTMPFVKVNYKKPGTYSLTLETNTNSTEWVSLYNIDYLVKRKWYFSVVAIIIYVLTIAALSYLTYKKQRKEHKHKYKTSSLSDNKAKEIVIKLIELIEKEQIYLDPEISLNILSEKLNCSKEYISQVINTEFKENFNTLMNKHRVNKAKYLLETKNGDFSSILEIAYEVGFNSKSAFNTAFKKFTNYTPTEYRKQYLKN